MPFGLDTDNPPASVGEEDGLICAFLCGAGGPARELDLSAAGTWLMRAGSGPAGRSTEPERGFVWLHFNLANNRSERWLRQHAPLPDSFYDALKDGVTSTRLERDEQSLVAVLNDVQFDFSFEPSDTATLWISVSDRLAITARVRPLRSIDRLRARVRSGEGIRSTVELLERLLRAQADTLVEIVRGVTARIDTIEDELLSGRLRTKRVRLGTLRRLLVRLQRLLAPEPAALFRLLQHPPAWMAEFDVQELRQATEEFSVVLRDMTALQERIKLLQEELAAQVNEDNNRSLYLLTMVTVLALPINIVAGLMGMNVGGVPLAQHTYGFWIVVALIATFTVAAGRLVFRARRED